MVPNEKYFAVVERISRMATTLRDFLILLVNFDLLYTFLKYIEDGCGAQSSSSSYFTIGHSWHLLIRSLNSLHNTFIRYLLFLEQQYRQNYYLFLQAKT